MRKREKKKNYEGILPPLFPRKSFLIGRVFNGHFGMKRKRLKGKKKGGRAGIGRKQIEKKGGKTRLPFSPLNPNVSLANTYLKEFLFKIFPQQNQPLERNIYFIRTTRYFT